MTSIAEKYKEQYGLDSLNGLKADNELVHADYSQRRRLIKSFEPKLSEAVKDRSDQEVKLHEAKKDLYEVHPLENDREFDSLLEQLFSEPVDKQVAIATENTAAEKPSLANFDGARVLLASKQDELKGKVSIEQFEEAYRFFVEQGVADLDKAFEKEKRGIAKKKQLSGSLFTLANAQERLREIRSRIAEGGEDADVLSKALTEKGLNVDDVETLVEVADIAGKEVLPKIEEAPFELNFTRIFFFLRDQAPVEMADGEVFDQLTKPFFELIAKRVSDDQDLKQPKEPDPKRIKNKNSLRQKVATYKKRKAAFPAKLEKSIPEIYQFILKKLGETGSDTISKRLEELN